MNEFVETLLEIPWHEPKRAYDVVIIGGGGHGLSAAYHLAARHGITNVAVVEANYIGSGNSGRNTTIIRSNYGVPESVRFYQHSVDLYKRLEEETGCWIMHSTRGLMWLVHTESGMRGERARAMLNTACGTDTYMIGPEEAKQHSRNSTSAVAAGTRFVAVPITREGPRLAMTGSTGHTLRGRRAPVCTSFSTRPSPVSSRRLTVRA